MKEKFNFYLNGQKLAINDQYQYLGIKLRPSGSLKLAADELSDKAMRSWFSISHLIYKNKRMEADKVFGIFDSLVTPVATYGCEFWAPYLINNSGLKSQDRLYDTWESFRAETINQKCCRTFLSVHNKTSRLAILGELGRYPLFIKVLAQCLKYKIALLENTSNILIKNLVIEMSHMVEKGQDCWLSRVTKIESLLNLKNSPTYRSKALGKNIASQLKSKFDLYWLRKINAFRAGKDDTLDHNKLRTYRIFKGSFKREPYIDYIRNRNQRSFLTRLRVGAHSLAIELGRRSRPVVPISDRICSYCLPSSDCDLPNQTASHSSDSGLVDDELHFLTKCSRFSNARRAFYSAISASVPNFQEMNDDHKFVTIMCPTNPQLTKTINRYIKFMFDKREKIDLGINLYNL